MKEFECECGCGSVMKVFTDLDTKEQIEITISNVFKYPEEDKWAHNFIISKDKLRDVLG